MAQHNATKTPRKKSSSAMAIQASHKDGKTHAVGIWNLRVLIVPDGRFWFAQGFEIDYAVQGDSVEDVKTKFQNGLRATVHHHLQFFGTIDGLMRVAPNNEWLDLWKAANAQQQRHSQISMHKVIPKGKSNSLPFENIVYAEVLKAAAAA